VQVRCIITGPQDTPYEAGLFVFDVFFPEGYPNVPPLMVLETTGDGRARFNPNLYAGESVKVDLG
jgi:ubiquitin-protein ligase